MPKILSCKKNRNWLNASLYIQFALMQWKNACKYWIQWEAIEICAHSSDRLMIGLTQRKFYRSCIWIWQRVGKDRNRVSVRRSSFKMMMIGNNSEYFHIYFLYFSLDCSHVYISSSLNIIIRYASEYKHYDQLFLDTFHTYCHQYI